MGLEHLVLRLLRTLAGRLIIGLLMILLGSFAIAFSYPQFDSMQALRLHGSHTMAKIIDQRVSTGMHFDHSYDIRYGFRVMPRGQWYERSEKGPLARKELWATLSKAQWEEVTKVGHIEIEYLPADPSVNEIAGRAGKELLSCYIIFGVGVLLVVAGAAMASIAVFRLLSAKPTPMAVSRVT